MKMPAQNSEGTVGWGTGEGGQHEAGCPGEEMERTDSMVTLGDTSAHMGER